MSKATDTKMMDTEPGGEQTQYGGRQIFVDDSRKEKSSGQGQFSDSSAQNDDNKKDEQSAGNIRSGDGGIGEDGFAGKTKGNSGSAQSAVGYGGLKRDDGVEEGTKQMRREQGYGGGSGVGA